MAVAADHDVLHFQHERRELDSRRRAVIAGIRLEGRDERADVADHEQVAGKAVGEQVGHHARVGTPQEQRARLLPILHQPLVVVAEAREEVPPEAPAALR